MNRIWPRRNILRSAACGSFTLTTISARANNSCGVSTILAPALEYSSSVRPDPTPADFSINDRVAAMRELGNCGGRQADTKFVVFGFFWCAN